MCQHDLLQTQLCKYVLPHELCPNGNYAYVLPLQEIICVSCMHYAKYFINNLQYGKMWSYHICGRKGWNKKKLACLLASLLTQVKKRNTSRTPLQTGRHTNAQLKN